MSSFTKRTTRFPIIAGLLAVTSMLVPTADAALIGRLPDGSGNFQAYFDDDLNVTWLAASNYAALELSDARVVEIIDAVGSVNGHTLTSSDFVSDGAGNYSGLMTWWGAMAWVSELNFAGLSDWRLPIGDSCGGWDCTTSEMGHLYYLEGGGDASSLTGLFTDLQQDPYWSNYTNTDGTITTFRFSNGLQAFDVTHNVHYAWAVHAGDIAAVPVPASLWLLTSGLMGLISVARRRQ